MISFRDFIELSMAKQGVKSQAELLRRMKEVDPEGSYCRQHLNGLILSREYRVPYEGAIEKALGLEKGVLGKVRDNGKLGIKKKE